MSKISSLKISNATDTKPIIKVDYPDVEGFIISLSYIDREDLVKIRNSSVVYKFSNNTRQREETIDNDKFLEEYSRRAIKGWIGLKVKHLPKLLPVDISHADGEEEIPYSEDEAFDLLKNSAIFDTFITDCMNDFEKFSIKKRDEETKN